MKTSIDTKLVPRSFYQRYTVDVARDLLGKVLISRVGGFMVGGIITETEAYCFDDAACHAFRGKTERNKALFGPVGHSYVYFIYGNHFCCNVVARLPDSPAGGVLIRALQPLYGIEVMQQRRHLKAITLLANGPGKLTQALGITRALEHVDLTQEGPLSIMQGIKIDSSLLHATPRIGISQAQDLLWRFVVKQSE